MAKGEHVNGGRAATVIRMPSVASGVDFSTVVASHYKNLKALAEANKLALEGMQAVVSRQCEIGQQTLQEFSSMIAEFAQRSGSPVDRLAKHAEYSKQALEKGVSHTREIRDVMRKSSADAANVIIRRMTESLDEVREFASKASAT